VVIILLASVVNPYKTEVAVIQSQIEQLQAGQPLLQAAVLMSNVSRLEGQTAAVQVQAQTASDSLNLVKRTVLETNDQLIAVNGSLTRINKILSLLNATSQLIFNSTVGRAWMGETIMFVKMNNSAFWKAPMLTMPETLVTNPLVIVNWTLCDGAGAWGGNPVLDFFSIVSLDNNYGGVLLSGGILQSQTYSVVRQNYGMFSLGSIVMIAKFSESAGKQPDNNPLNCMWFSIRIVY
jgi:hypothetical protein